MDECRSNIPHTLDMVLDPWKVKDNPAASPEVQQILKIIRPDWKQENIRAKVSTCDFFTHLILKQRRLRRACAFAQTRQSLRCLNTQSMDIYEVSDQNLGLWSLWMRQPGC